MKNNDICVTGPKFTSRDRTFERSRVNLLSYIEKKIGTGTSLREIEVRVIESHLYRERSQYGDVHIARGVLYDVF